MILKNKWMKKRILTASAVLLSLALAGTPLTAAAKVEDDAIYTEDGIEDYGAELARNKAEAVQTNLDSAWPQGPAIGAAGAVVMDADSGAVLYGKNMEKHLYPASITKLMTALLAYENLDPTDTVTFSENAVFSIERGSSNIGMDAGESITVDQALYGLMIASANEVAIALGETVSGTETDFVALMNQRAVELGCRNTHFVTTNGLHDSDHYTCAYDMALIAREIYKHPDLVEYMSQTNYHFEPSEKQPDDFWIPNTNDFLTGEIPCEDVVGGKTGYTDQARQTLVTFAKRDGKRLVCVIMREESPYQYYDTVDLLEYAFDNFKQIDITKEEKRFTQTPADFLSTGTDIFGNGKSSFYIRDDSKLMIPNNVSFSDLTAEIIPLPYKPAGQEEGTAKSEDTAEEDKTAEDKTSGQPAQTEQAEQAEQAGQGATSQAAAAGTQKAAEYAAEVEPPLTQDFSSQEDGSKVVGVVQYKFHNYSLGSADVLFRSSLADSEQESADIGSTAASADTDTKAPGTIHGIKSLLFGLVHTGAHGSVYLNILLLVPMILVITFILCIIFIIYDYFARRSSRYRKKQRRAQRENRKNASRTANDERHDEGQTYRSGPDYRSRRGTAARPVSASARNGRTVPSDRTGTNRRTNASSYRGTAGRRTYTGQNTADRRTDRSSSVNRPSSNRTAGGKYSQNTRDDGRSSENRFVTDRRSSENRFVTDRRTSGNRSVSDRKTSGNKSYRSRSYGDKSYRDDS